MKRTGILAVAIALLFGGASLAARDLPALANLPIKKLASERAAAGAAQTATKPRAKQAGALASDRPAGTGVPAPRVIEPPRLEQR